jgi:GntP family gluconate:H+ symporter
MPILTELVSVWWWPLIVLSICVVSIVVLIARIKVHPFLALMIVAVLAGVLAGPGALEGKPGSNRWIQAVELSAAEFGNVCGRVGIVIGLASVIGICIMESGAADKLVRRLLALMGEKRAGHAIAFGGFPLGMPIFFDTFFMLLIPIARALRLRTGKDYVLYVLAICTAGAVTHSLVAPHPGPLAMAEILKVDLGWSIIAGILVSFPVVLFGWQVAKAINRRTDVPLRETTGLSLKELEKVSQRPESELPGLWAALSPVVLPIFLISTASFLAAFKGADQGILPQALAFLGNRNVALFIGALLAMWLVVKHKGGSTRPLHELIGGALETAGVIILITSAGGAFGLMLNHAGVGDAIRYGLSGSGISLVLVAWAIAALLKFSLGSATVSMLTSASMMAGFLAGGDLPYHPMYLFIAIGYGALGLSWMNDSGFWVIGRLSGFTERETLRTWTVLAFSMSAAGLVETLILSKLLPFNG